MLSAAVKSNSRDTISKTNLRAADKKSSKARVPGRILGSFCRLRRLKSRFHPADLVDGVGEGRVVAVAAEDGVDRVGVLVVADQGVVGDTAVEGVGAVAAADLVVAGLAEEGVGAAEAAEVVAVVAAADHFVAVRAVDAIHARAALDRHLARERAGGDGV